MKKTLIRVSCIALLGLLSAGCQKEAVVECPIPVEQGVTSYLVRYSNGETTGQTTLNENVDLEGYMLRLMALAREGYTISVFNNNSLSGTVSCKKTVVYRTSSEEDAAHWSAEKIKEGYLVTITFDEDTKYIIDTHCPVHNSKTTHLSISFLCFCVSVFYIYSRIFARDISLNS